MSFFHWNHPHSAVFQPVRLAGVVAGVFLTLSIAHAQDVGKTVTDAIADQISPNRSTAAGQTTQSATERGVNRAIQGTIQGQSPRDAIRSGLGEAAQSAVETPRQTMLRDQNQAFQQGPFQQGPFQQGRGTFPPAGQNWQRDAQGRFYYQDDSGRTIYRDQLQQQTAQTRNWFAGDQQAQQSGYFGSTVQAQQNGLAVNSIRENSFADNLGLRDGDVLLSVNGRGIATQSLLSEQLNQAQPGELLRIRVLRNGQEETIAATMPPQPTYSVAKPAIQRGSLASQVEALREEVAKLKSELDSLKTQYDAATQQ